MLFDSVHNRILSLPSDFLLYPAHDYKGQSGFTLSLNSLWDCCRYLKSNYDLIYCPFLYAQLKIYNLTKKYLQIRHHREHHIQSHSSSTAGTETVHNAPQTASVKFGSASPIKCWPHPKISVHKYVPLRTCSNCRLYEITDRLIDVFSPSIFWTIMHFLPTEILKKLFCYEYRN